MKKSLFLKITLILLLVFNSLKSQKNNLEYQNDNLIQNLGIGLVQFTNTAEKIKLYSDNTFTQTKNIKIGSSFIPILNKPDYGILFFVCVEKKTNYYKLAISKNDFAYIKPSQNFLYYTWESFLKDQVSGIKSKNIKSNSPRATINGKLLNTATWKNDDEIEIIKIQDNWIQIRNISQNRLFWIQWRDEKELKVYLNLLI